MSTLGINPTLVHISVNLPPLLRFRTTSGNGSHDEMEKNVKIPEIEEEKKEITEASFQPD